MNRRYLPVVVPIVCAILLAGCAGRRKQVVAVTPPTVYVPSKAVEMPKGVSPDMKTPTRLADGRYLTPNRNLSPAGQVWHLRSGLNVAALACRGTQEATMVAQYNTLIATQKAPLKSAQDTLAREYKSGGGDWQDRLDDAMTRLYNFFSQSFARDDFCAASAATLADAQTVTAAGLAEFAANRLPLIEKPFTDVYAAFDAWKAASAPRPALAAAAPGQPQAMPAPAQAPIPATPVSTARDATR